MNDKLFYFNICQGCYTGYIAAHNQNDAQIKLIQAFSKIQSVHLGNVEITELIDVSNAWNAEAAQKSYADRKMLAEEYNIYCK